MTLKRVRIKALGALLPTSRTLTHLIGLLGLYLDYEHLCCRFLSGWLRSGSEAKGGEPS